MLQHFKRPSNSWVVQHKQAYIIAEALEVKLKLICEILGEE